MSGTSRCDCGATIVWVRTQGGNSMPCDPTEVDVLVRESGKRRRGDLTIVTDDGFIVSGARPAAGMFSGSEQGTTARGRVPHWATCPNAEQHRKGKR